MIIDKLKEIEQNNHWGHKYLDGIDGTQLLNEIKEQYDNIVPIDYVFYSTIPSNILEIIMEQTNSGEYNVFGANPFYERLLVQVLYMEARGLDPLYGKAVMAVVAPAEAALFFEEILAAEREYDFLWAEYNRYLNKSYNSVMNQSNILNNLVHTNTADFEELINKLKDFIPKEGK